MSATFLLNRGPEPQLGRFVVGPARKRPGIMDLPVGLTMGERLALHNAGYSTSEAVIALPTEELGLYVGWQCSPIQARRGDLRAGTSGTGGGLMSRQNFKPRSRSSGYSGPISVIVQVTGNFDNSGNFMSSGVVIDYHLCPLRQVSDKSRNKKTGRGYRGYQGYRLL
jgi:hypothetical protein